MKKSILNKVITLIFVAVIYFIVSFFLLELYVSGDQAHYHKFYNEIYNVSFFEISPIARDLISSSEPLSWLVLWCGSNLGVDKNIWISLINVFLIVGLVLLLQKYHAPWYVCILVLTNFYVVVLMTSAERLKISYAILFWAFVFDGRLKLLLLMLSPLAHLQSLILLPCAFLAYISGKFRQVVLNHKLNLIFFCLIGLAFLFVLNNYFYNEVNSKLSSYVGDEILLSHLPPILILLTIGLLVVRDKYRMFLSMLPLVIAVLILGGWRINMVAVSVFLALLIVEKRASHPLVLLVLLYLAIKSIPFLYNIYFYGNGFGGDLI